MFSEHDALKEIEDLKMVVQNLNKEMKELKIQHIGGIVYISLLFEYLSLQQYMVHSFSFVILQPAPLGSIYFIKVIT